MGDFSSVLGSVISSEEYYVIGWAQVATETTRVSNGIRDGVHGLGTQCIAGMPDATLRVSCFNSFSPQTTPWGKYSCGSCFLVGETGAQRR